MATASIRHNDVGATLTTWLYVCYWIRYALEQEGVSSYIEWPQSHSNWLSAHHDPAKFAQEKNAYNWYFKQPDSAFRAVAPPADFVCEWNRPSPVGDIVGRHQLFSLPLAGIKSFYQKNLVFSDEVEKRGRALQATHSLDFNNIIGITWRGTDSCNLPLGQGGDGRPRLSIEVYFSFLDEILEKEPNLRIMASAEEERVLDKLLARYPMAFTIPEFYSAPHGATQNPEKLSPHSGFERGMVPALMVWSYSQCKHYIKNRSSMASTAAWLSSGRIVSIAHSENLGYDKMDDQAEINGERFPLRR